jgi:hypothetical protein
LQNAQQIILSHLHSEPIKTTLSVLSAVSEWTLSSLEGKANCDTKQSVELYFFILQSVESITMETLRQVFAFFGVNAFSLPRSFMGQTHGSSWVL